MAVRPNTILIRDEGMRKRVMDHIAALNLEKEWDITIKQHVKRRTLSQNALMWKWVHDVANAVSEYTGMDPEDVHEFFKRKFLSPKVIEIGGEVVERYSTKNLDKAEMSEYMDRIYAFCTTELGLILPVPEMLYAPPP